MLVMLVMMIIIVIIFKLAIKDKSSFFFRHSKILFKETSYSDIAL